MLAQLIALLQTLWFLLIPPTWTVQIYNVPFNPRAAAGGGSIAFDASSEGATTADTNDVSWTHTPVGTPKGIVVFCIADGASATFDGATYGGTAMTLVGEGHDSDTAELGIAYGFFLGSSISAGAQTVVCDRGAAGTGMNHGVAFSVTASANTQLAGTFCTLSNANSDDPSCNVTGITGISLGFGGLYSGLGSEGAATAISGYTIGPSAVLTTSRISTTTYQTTSQSGATNTVGFVTTIADDEGLIGLAVQPVP